MPKKVSVQKYIRDLVEEQAQHGRIIPSDASPLCLKCGLCKQGAEHPFLEYEGSENPLITVVSDTISKMSDVSGSITDHGSLSYIRRIMKEYEKIDENFKVDEHVRFMTITRCCARTGKLPNPRIKGNWCRWFAIQDIAKHRPRLLMTVGTAVLGLFNLKGNAQEWGGKLLTYRGWPDDWLANIKYDEGHPIFGPAPDWRIPLYPVQSHGIVHKSQNRNLISLWQRQVLKAVRHAMKGTVPRQYNRPWFLLTKKSDEVIRKLRWLSEHAGTKVSFDTETTGLKPWVDGAKVVFVMLRWSENGEPRSVAFPWDYPESPLREYVDEIRPHLLDALYKSKLVGHNLTFDVLFMFGTNIGADLNRLADAMHADTWHMLYTLRQKEAYRGLDILPYEWVSDMAGYEEEMTILIEKYGDLLNPENEKGGHYARCPENLWRTHLKPYVLGDVEVPYIAEQKMRDKLGETGCHQIPLASPEKRGCFINYVTPSRLWVYDKIMVPACRTLTKIMGRGMHVDLQALDSLEDMMPKQIRKARRRLRRIDPRIAQWCEQQEATEPKWVLDLESKAQLKQILFKVLGLPVKKLTPQGRKELGEELDGLSAEELYEFAAVDKFTLNALAVDHAEIRPLQNYRKLFKLYTTYIKPLRNCFAKGVDKKKRTDVPHLMPDGNVHASFLLTGSRSGRLSSRDPNLQNLPKDAIIKKVYASRYGDAGCIYQGDLSQIELRLLAAACGDPSMVEAYWKDIDLHSMTTSKLFGIPYDDFSDEHMKWLQDNEGDKYKEMTLKRKIGKTTNFLTGYGGGAYGLMTTLANAGIYLELKRCEEIIENFFDNYPTLRRHIQAYKWFIAENGCAVSLFGRVRIFDEVFSEDREAKSKALRAGYNHLIQSTASDMMLLCLSAIEMVMRNEGLESILVSTVHDSLVIDAKREELPVVHEICENVISNIPEILKMMLGDDYNTSWCIVPFGGDFTLGLNYYQEIKITGDPDWDKLLVKCAKTV